MRSLPGKTREKEAVIPTLRAFFSIASVFLADRFLKNWAESRFIEGHSEPILPGVLHWTLVHNRGAAFGFLRGAGFFLTVFSLTSVLVLAFFLFQKLRRKPSGDFADWAWGLVIGGALGNLVDRWRFGYVIDYLDLRVWPVFNLADAAICVGVGWILFSAMLGKGKA